MWHNGIGGISGVLGRRFHPLGPSQWVKDLAQLWFRSQLRLGSDPWPRNSICRRTSKKTKTKNPTPEASNNNKVHIVKSLAPIPLPSFPFTLFLQPVNLNKYIFSRVSLCNYEYIPLFYLLFTV